MTDDQGDVTNRAILRDILLSAGYGEQCTNFLHESCDKEDCSCLCHKFDEDADPLPPGRNRVRCLLCSDVIESRHRHDFVTCKCGAVSVDGGTSYNRRCWDGKKGNPEDLWQELP